MSVVLFLLVSASCWLRLVQEAMYASLCEASRWGVELGFLPLMGKTMSRSVFRGGSEVRKTLGSLLIGGAVFLPCGAVFLPCWLFGLRPSSPGANSLLDGDRHCCQNGSLCESSHP